MPGGRIPMTSKSMIYSKTQLLKKYIQYYLKAGNSKGHGIHSPFVFDFIIHVLQDKKKYPAYKLLEQLREELLRNNDLIQVEDLGAGTALKSAIERKISNIAGSSLKSKKFAQLLFRIIKYYKPQTILELGASFGITTSYMAHGNPAATIYTLEGSKNIASIAKQVFFKSNAEHINLIIGNFDKTLPEILAKINVVDLAFIDGNHKKEPTLNYFDKLLDKSGPDSIFIFDDIHWSSEMEEAWKHIQNHPAVTLSIDLFFIGLVFFNTSFKAKQHFEIRF